MTRKTTLADLDVKLLEEVEALCAKYVGKGAEGEMWAETCERLVRLDRLAKKIRRTLKGA